MRKGVVIATLLFFVGCMSGAALARQGYTIYGHGNSSCGEWLAERKKDGWGTIVKEAWVIGFVSGAGYTGPPMKQSDTAGLLAFMDQHCTSHPLEKMEAGARALVNRLGVTSR